MIRKIGSVISWFAFVAVGAALFWVNILGHDGEPSVRRALIAPRLVEHYRGWPLIISAHFPDEDLWELGVGDSHEELKGLGNYALSINAVYSLATLFCTFLAMKYLNRRWRGRPQFSINELLVLTTAFAILCSLILTVDFWPHTDIHRISIYVFQPLHKLPLFLQIPLWFGVFCTAAVLATAMIDGVRFLVTRKKETTDL